MSYNEELADLRASIPASDMDEAHYERVRDVLRARTLTVVGSGGTLAVAELVALAHRTTTGRLAETSTPLQFAESTVNGEVALFLSARAKHPDTALAVRHALDAGIEIILITQRLAHELTGPLADPRIIILTAPSTGRADGFLATGSVASMAGVVARLYGQNLDELFEFEVPALANLGEQVLVLHSGVGAAAARDIETRMHELGLAAVQVADYRNFAHGRHVGLSRNSDITTVIALIAPPAIGVAERTLAALPSGLDVREIRTAWPGVTGATQLLLAAMSAPVDPAKQAGVEPSKPKVAPFGRKLYHLPSARALPVARFDPVDRKLQAMGVMVPPGDIRQRVERAESTWRRRIQTQTFRGILLDYDGTCVTSQGRFDLPDPKLQGAILHALQLGIPVGFATGRGQSLYRDLRAWVPEPNWAQISLALHNGTWRQSLNDDLRKPSAQKVATEVAASLQWLDDANVASIEVSGAQTTLSPRDPSLSTAALRATVEALLSQTLATSVKVASSGHSVDIVPAGSGKRAAFESFEQASGQSLVIGDRGEPGGNDHELLDASEWTISVDSCSARLDRCWPVTDFGLRGPGSTAAVLWGLRRVPDGVRLRLPPLKRTVK